MKKLVLKNINKIYANNVQAVFDFNLEIEDKEFIVFVGPSGCGKSTTLRMIAGLEDITSGELFLDGDLINDVSPKDRNMAMVFQGYALYPQYTVYDNVAFSLRFRKTYCPVYEPNEEIARIESENKKLRVEAHHVDKKFASNQDSTDLLAEREKIYDRIFANNEKIEKLRVQVVGIDNDLILDCKKQIKTLNKQNAKSKKDIDRYYFDNEAKKNDLLNIIRIKEEKIKQLEEKVAYLSKTEVPLTKLRKLNKNEIDDEVNRVARIIDLTRYLYRRPAALSGGQRQRVALGRAIVRKPKIFLMDEPLSNLDAKLRAQTRSEIIKIHERAGATTIYVTHDQVEAMTMASRIVIMKDGYVQQIGTPSEIYNHPANKFVAGFIGSPASNFIEASFDGENLTIPCGGAERAAILLNDDLTECLRKSGKTKFILGIRPENIRFGAKDEENSLDVVCDFSELLGELALNYFYIDNVKMVMKTEAKQQRKQGENMSVVFDKDAIMIFDGDNEMRLKVNE